jgi:hypothetical protein
VVGHARAVVVSVALVLAVVAACGARTGLNAPLSTQQDNNSAETEGGSRMPPAMVEAGAPLPPVMVTQPPSPMMSGCDGGATLVYVVTQQNRLLSFNPPTASFSSIGQLACPVTISADAAPFSMAVDRSGTAYVVFANPNHTRAELFRVSLATAACRPTGFVSPSDFTPTFGMGYSTNVADGGESLYLASSEDAGSRLATLDTRTFTLDVIAPLDPPIRMPELTGTGAGDLFAFWGGADGSAIAQIDKSSAHSVEQSLLPGVFPTQAWAFAIWGGDFYTFTSSFNANESIVTRYRPADGSIVEVARYPDDIVGAGVSTCAPLR